VGAELPDEIAAELLTGERVIWIGGPDPRRIFTAADLIIIPFTLIWCTILIFVFVTVVTHTSAGYALIFVPFLLSGLYLVAGRFVAKRWAARRTVYMLTDRRVLVFRVLGRFSVRSEPVERLPTLEPLLRADGSGTIRFRNPPFGARLEANTGLDLVPGYDRDRGLVFYDVPDARTVLALLEQVRQDAA
jgi:hypothetical protein